MDNLDFIIQSIIATADEAVEERWVMIGEVTDVTMGKLRDLMERYHKIAGGEK